MSRRGNRPSVSFFAFQDIITSVVGIFVLIMMILVLELVETTEVRKSSQNRNFVDQALIESIDSLVAENVDLATTLDRLHAADANVLNSFNAKQVLEETRNEIEISKDRLEAELQKQAKLKTLVEKEELETRRLQALSESKIEDRKELGRLDEQVKSLTTKADQFTSQDSLVFKETDIGGRSLVVIDIRSDATEILLMAAGQRKKLPGQDSRSLIEFIRQLDARSNHVVVFVRPKAVRTFDAFSEFLDRSGLTYGFDVVGDSTQLKMFEALDLPTRNSN